MDLDRVEKLTEAEREVLRCWFRMSAKEIGARLNVSHHAVNERLRSARHRLGVASSQEAAALLEQYESGTYKRLVSKPETIAAGRESPIIASSDEDRDWSPRSATSEAVREERAAYSGSFPLWQRMALPILLRQGKRNELNLSRLLGSVSGMMLVIILTLAGLVAIAWGAVRMVYGVIHLVS